MKTPEEMRQLEELFHQAVGLDAGQRAFFIDRLRSSNPALGAEVESLVQAYEQKASFIESPAYEAAAHVIGDSRMQLKAGESVGKYKIVSALGHGGMGDVYLADDPALGRQVALKLLPDAFTADPDRLRRFVQEARAASALNHPNILTIHEIGEADGAHFIATEFVKGHTLRHHLAKRAIEFTDALEIAIQVASALEAAHEAGIIHRDIKPENIMLRPDGYVKILDFGLAKLTESSVGSRLSADSEIPTIARNYTEPGIMMGTISYMSPEQARGLLVGPQTDIFSLGVVMYEMIAGRTPFAGQTDADVIVSILSKDHPPLRAIAAKMPGGFEAIVDKALKKEREERYQTAGELLSDLKKVKQDLLFEQKFGKTEQPTLVAARALENSPRVSTENVIRETEVVSGRITTSRRMRPALALVLTSVAAAVVIGGTVIWYRAQSTEAPLAPVQATAQRTLSFFVTVQKYRDGKPYEKSFRLRDDINFERDYRLRLTVTSPQVGFLYIFNEEVAESDKTPSFVIMFPSETANNGSAQLNENQQIQIPERTEFQFDEHQGTERIWLVWADRRLDALEALKRFANSKDKGLVDKSETDRLAEFLRSHRPTNPSVERTEEKPETILRASSDILVHLISLAHH
jgi:serine/threonine protein kinase